MTVVTFAEARQTVERHARRLKPAGTETVELLQARDRVLAEPLTADRDFPPFPRAVRDGYAVRSADLTQLPAHLEIVGEIKAGAPPDAFRGSAGRGTSERSRDLLPGQAVEIMTGAPVPPGADSVLMVEYTSRDGNALCATRSTEPGENFVPQGAEARAGDQVLASGCRITPAIVALAASIGRSSLRVHLRPRVAIVATGDELVELEQQPGPSQIRNSNSYSLATQVALAGGEALILPIARDEVDHLRTSIRRGLSADLLLLSGGVSLGKYDLVEQVLEEFQAEFFFTGAMIQPGKPIVFGQCHAESAVPRSRSEAAAGNDGHFFFGLPGNPLSTMVTFELFARPLIDVLCGAAIQPLLFLQAKLKSETRVKTGLTRFLPAVLDGQFETAEVAPVRWQGSGDVGAGARANCYLVVPPDRECLSAGELVSVLVK